MESDRFPPPRPFPMETKGAQAPRRESILVGCREVENWHPEDIQWANPDGCQSSILMIFGRNIDANKIAINNPLIAHSVISTSM